MRVIGYTESGSIRAIIDGTEFIVPNDAANRHRQTIGAWEGQGNEIKAYEAPLPATSEYQEAVQAMIDDVARSKLFHDGVTLASYTASTVGPWVAQAQTFVAWRDIVWQYSYSELAKMQAGERAQPSLGDFLLELPKIIWPSGA